MGRLGRITRRTFLGLGVAGAGGLAVGYYYYKKPYENPLIAAASEGEAVFNPYIKISADNQITIIAPRAEMGQGVQTTLAALVAEELEVSLDQVIVEHGPVSPAYFNAASLVDGGPFAIFDDSALAEISRDTFDVAAKLLGLQFTLGSSSMKDAFVKMRQAGCAARLVLVEAAAQNWGVAAVGLTTENGVITNPADGRVLTFGAVAKAASKLPPPTDLKLKPPQSWKILGKSQSRVDLLHKATGAAIYSIDVQLPDMLYGTVKMSPCFGKGFRSVDRKAALAVRGVLDVIEIDTRPGRGFGIIAENTWAAFRGADALKVDWEKADDTLDAAMINSELDRALSDGSDFSLGRAGDPADVIKDAPDHMVHEAEYTVPYLAHVTMEPMNATAQLKDGHLTIWTGSQTPRLTQMICAAYAGVKAENVTMNVTPMGGGFGRRSEADFAIYATVMAAKTKGRPIKVTWSREEDVRQDTFRPVAKGRYKAALSSDGDITALKADIATPSVMNSILGRIYPPLFMPIPEKTVLEGAFDQPLSVDNKRYGAHLVDLPVPVGFWRSVGNSFNPFFQESFLDEMAHKSGRDPLEFRLAHMNGEAFFPGREVLKKVAKMAGWGRPMAAGTGLGLAHTVCFGTWVAEVVEVAVIDDEVVIKNVWCAADPGLVLDPDSVRAQMMSGIVFGLSQALGQEISFHDGMVEQSNFHDFDVMHMAQCPSIFVEMLENAPGLGGAGETGQPPVIPALANAIFAATGKRLRHMPLSRDIGFA